MDLMQYKSFTWPYNPSECSLSCDRGIIRHKYPELNANELEDVDIDSVVITGSGEFFGPNAYQDWGRLRAIFKEGGVGTFYHPVFTDVTMALMKKLDSSLIPRENYVQYSFEFWQHLPAVAPVNIRIMDASKVLKLGDTGQYVLQLQNKLITSGITLASGATGVFNQETETGVRRYQSMNNLEINGIGDEATLKIMGITLPTTTSSPLTNSATTNYTVKKGDTLSKICARYGKDWHLVAAANKIKDPNVIYPGQIIVL